MRYTPEANKRNGPPTPICWHREASPCICVRFELSTGESHIFPYQHLVTASLVRANGGETLRLVFSSHDVEIIGKNLRELLAGFQDFAMKWIRTIPESYHPLVESGMISSIRVISQAD